MFTAELYAELKRQGTALGDFVDQQLSKLGTKDADLISSGLTLDVLAYHTTPLGNAQHHTALEVLNEYRHRCDVLPGLIQRLKDLYLLADPRGRFHEDRGGVSTRLAHDTLAPLIRERFDKSVRPGQRARRILENRGEEWSGSKVGATLDEQDLRLVELGAPGMRALNVNEERLLDASCRARARRQRRTRTLRVAGVVTVLVILLSAGLAWWQRKQAIRAEIAAEARALAAQAEQMLTEDRPEALRRAILGWTIDPIPEAHLAVAHAFPQIRVWLQDHSGGIVNANFSPDGRRIVTASLDGTARVWNPESGRALLKLNSHDRVGLMDAEFSPDGLRIVTAGGEGSAIVWDAINGKLLVRLNGHQGDVWHATFSPDGHRIVTAGEYNTAVLWNADSGQLLSRLIDTAAPIHPDRGIIPLGSHFDSSGDIKDAAFSPDGATVVTAGTDHTARLWSAVDGRLKARLQGHTAAILHATFSPDGTRILTASSDNTAGVWNANRGSLIMMLKGHSGALNDAAFSSDGQRIVTASDDHTARVWNAVSGEVVALIKGHRERVWRAAFSPDGNQIVTASQDSSGSVWNAANGQLLVRLEGHWGPWSTWHFRLTARALLPLARTHPRESGIPPAVS